MISERIVLQKGQCKMTIKRKIERILALAMEISPPDVKHNYEKKPTVFVSYSGHCSCLTVDVYENGWKSGGGAESTTFNMCSMYMKKDAKETHKQLDEIIHYLEKIKRRKCT